MASKRAILKARQICKDFGVNYRFVPYSYRGSTGYSLPSEQRIYADKSVSDYKFFSIVFHEIAHCINYKKGKFKTYHSSRYLSRKYLSKIALRAEVYTDNVAKKLAKKYGIKYEITYKFDDISRDWLLEYYGVIK